MSPIPKGLPVAPVAVAVAAKLATADEVIDNFMAFLQ
jgi:hypothetical protein